MDWTRKNLLDIRKTLNERPQFTYDDGNPRVIRAFDNKGIRAEFMWYCKCLAEDDPEGWKKRLPPQAIELWEILGGSNDHLFVRVPQWFVDMGYLADIGAPGFLVLAAFARFAYFGEGVGILGKGDVERKTAKGEKFTMTFGETFVGREKIAKLTGMSLRTVDRIIASLVKKGHMECRRVGENTVVRKIMFMVGSH